MLKRNIGYKLLAIAIALVIWAHVNQSQNPIISREVRVPLQVRGTEPGYTVAANPKYVRVKVEGPRSHISSIAAEPDLVTAYIDLKGKKTAGRRVLPVRVDLPGSLAGLVRSHPIPREVAIRVNEKLSRSFKVETQFAGSPPVGYRFGDPQVSPSRVTVSGIAEDMGKVAKVTVAVDAGMYGEDGISGDFFAVPSDNRGRRVPGVELRPEKVHLRMELLKAPAKRVVFVSLDTVGQPPFPHKVGSIEIEPQTVTITGRPEQLMQVTTVKTEPVRLEGRIETFSTRARIIVPAGLALADEKYVQVTVKISRASGQVNKPSELDEGM